jgi:hypothetical protein
VRLAVFMNALEDDLAASGNFRVIVPACRPDPCSRSSGSEFLKAAHAAGADFLLVGGIHKMSTHCAVGESISGAARACSTNFSPSEGTQIRRGGAQKSSYQTNSLRLLPPMKLTGNNSRPPPIPLWVDTVEKVSAKKLWNSNLKRWNPGK